jgi:general secretion pathway protein G
MTRRHSQRGLTMLEIMIVIAILGLVMGLVVVPKIMAAKREADIRVARMAVNKLANQDYVMWTQLHPHEGCPADVEAVAGSRDAAIDPWDSRYQLYCGDTLPAEVHTGAAASSRGPDREDRTDDDIRSWASR